MQGHAHHGAGGLALSIGGNAIVSFELGAEASGGPAVYFGDATILGYNQSRLQSITVTAQDVPEPRSGGMLAMARGLLPALRRRGRAGLSANFTFFPIRRRIPAIHFTLSRSVRHRTILTY